MSTNSEFEIAEDPTEVWRPSPPMSFVASGRFYGLRRTVIRRLRERRNPLARAERALWRQAKALKRHGGVIGVSEAVDAMQACAANMQIDRLSKHRYWVD